MNVSMDELEAARAVQRMQDYIDANLTRPITAKELAREAGYSSWHAARMFRELTGRTPFDYIRSLRLSKAAMLLRDGSPRVLDVALDFVFDSHEGFTRAFSREFGLPPGRYSKRPPPIPLFIPYSVLHSRQFEVRGERDMPEKTRTQTVFVQVVERPERKLLLKRGREAGDYFAYCSEVGCDVWGLLTSVKEALYEPVGLWLPEKLRTEGTSRYVQGVELPADYSGPAAAGYELIDLAPCSMMVFQGEPYDDERFEDAIDDLWEVMKRYDPKLYGYEWADEEAPRFQLAPMGYRGYIEARPVRPLREKNAV